jgi:Tfp pilus assembly protein PilF
MGRNEDAAKTYQEAVRLNRREKTVSPWPPMNYGVFLLKQDKVSEAEPHLRDAVRIAPGFAQGNYQLGLLLERQQKTAEAVGQLEQAASLDAAYADPWWALARIHAAAGRSSEAESARAEFQARKKANEEKKKQTAGQVLPGR